MRASLALLVLLVSLLSVAWGSYTLKDSWVGQQIIDDWVFYSGSDPTHGYVYYATKAQAQSWDYVSVTNNVLTIRSDDTTISSGSGRGSVRINSPGTYSFGVFLFDVGHMPWGCGTWPAIWTANLDTWPNGGEIDILEGVNNVGYNQMTLHTGSGCTFPANAGGMSGTTLTTDCGANGGSVGCSIHDPNQNSYGQNFNNEGGGVFAMQWASTGIYVWFFPRGSIPADITSGSITLANWGTPRATWTFGSGCTSSFFYNHHLIIDNTFCGDWGNAVFGSQCGGTCNTYVQNNPGAFAQSYWTINSIKVYQ